MKETNVSEAEYYEIQAGQEKVRSENDHRYNWYKLEDAQAALDSLKNKNGCKIVFVKITRRETDC
jgi:hypothetical protein